MPERQHSRLFAAQIAGAENGVGMAVEQRLQQARILAWIVFQIGILDQAKIACRMLDGRAHRCALALVHRMADEPDAVIRGGDPLENRRGSVSGAVVDDDQLALHLLGQRRREHKRETPLDDRALVVNGHQNGQLHEEYQV